MMPNALPVLAVAEMLPPVLVTVVPLVDWAAQVLQECVPLAARVRFILATEPFQPAAAVTALRLPVAISRGRFGLLALS